MNRKFMRMFTIVIFLGLSVPLSGCIGGNTDYTVTTEPPTTGAVFDEVVNTEVQKDWSHTLSTEVTYSIPDSWVGPEGNLTGPNGTWSEQLEIVGVKFVDGTAETREQIYLRPDDRRWNGNFVLVDSDVQKFRISAEGGDELLDSINVTVTKS